MGWRLSNSGQQRSDSRDGPIAAIANAVIRGERLLYNCTYSGLCLLTGHGHKIRFEKTSRSDSDQGGTSISVSSDFQVVPELRRHDAMRLPQDQFLCFRNGRFTIYERKPYYSVPPPGAKNWDSVKHPRGPTCSEFHGLYDPDPYYRPR